MRWIAEVLEMAWQKSSSEATLGWHSRKGEKSRPFAETFLCYLDFWAPSIPIEATRVYTIADMMGRLEFVSFEDDSVTAIR